MRSRGWGSHDGISALQRRDSESLLSLPYWYRWHRRKATVFKAGRELLPDLLSYVGTLTLNLPPSRTVRSVYCLGPHSMVFCLQYSNLTHTLCPLRFLKCWPISHVVMLHGFIFSSNRFFKNLVNPTSPLRKNGACDHPLHPTLSKHHDSYADFTLQIGLFCLSRIIPFVTIVFLFSVSKETLD